MYSISLLSGYAQENHRLRVGVQELDSDFAGIIALLLQPSHQDMQATYTLLGSNNPSAEDCHPVVQVVSDKDACVPTQPLVIITELT
ncbi:MAG TPA: hypothetical protein VIH52_02475 [Candidatus Nanoarchaeia archaeon]